MRRLSMILALGIMALGMLVALAGCAVEQGKVYTKDGERYGVTSSNIWRSRWWNYYERGASYAAGEFWDEAIADLQQALKQRRKDQRRARTYGLHFLDYFPRRELGVVYYRLERFEDARRELEASLSSVETAKAKFYLNKVRATLLQQSGRDTTPPRLVLESPAQDLLTNRFTVDVTGRAEDDTYVASILINGQPQFIELVEPTLSFTTEVPLQDGANTIAIIARDLLGKESRQSLTVHLDRQGPLLSVEQVALLGAPPNQQAHIQGDLTDRSRITRFVLAGRAVPLPSETSGAFRQEVPVSAGATSVPFEVEDAAGNVTSGAIALRPGVGSPVRQGQHMLPGLPRWAALHTGTILSDAAPFPSVPQRLAQRDTSASLAITLADFATNETVYTDTVYLEGTVTSAHPITQFTVAGESLWRRQSRQLFFGYIVRLQQGENTLRLEAVDTQGNTAQRDIVITRGVQPSRQLDSRLQVTMMPFERRGTPSVLTETVYTSLFDAFVTQERFDLIEREQLEAVLRELTLSQTDLVDPVTAARTGRIVEAEGILVGTVTETPSALNVEVQFVDVETSQVLATDDVYGENVTLQTLKVIMDGLALKLRRHFPVTEGVLLSTKGRKGLVVGFARPDGIKPHMKILIFRAGEKITRGKRTFSAPDIVLGEARITSVSADRSEAVLLSSVSANAMRESDQIITK